MERLPGKQPWLPVPGRAPPPRPGKQPWSQPPLPGREPYPSGPVVITMMELEDEDDEWLDIPITVTQDILQDILQPRVARVSKRKWGELETSGVLEEAQRLTQMVLDEDEDEVYPRSSMNEGELPKRPARTNDEYIMMIGLPLVVFWLQTLTYKDFQRLEEAAPVFKYLVIHHGVWKKLVELNFNSVYMDNVRKVKDREKGSYKLTVNLMKKEKARGLAEMTKIWEGKYMWRDSLPREVSDREFNEYVNWKRLYELQLTPMEWERSPLQQHVAGIQSLKSMSYLILYTPLEKNDIRIGIEYSVFVFPKLERGFYRRQVLLYDQNLRNMIISTNSTLGLLMGRVRYAQLLNLRTQEATMITLPFVYNFAQFIRGNDIVFLSEQEGILYFYNIEDDVGIYKQIQVSRDDSRFKKVTLDGKYFIQVTREYVYRWNLETEVLENVIPYDMGFPSGINFDISPNGRYVFFGKHRTGYGAARDRFFKVMDLTMAGKEVFSSQKTISGTFYMDPPTKNIYLFAADNDRKIRIYNLTLGLVKRANQTIKLTTGVYGSIYISPDGKYILVDNVRLYVHRNPLVPFLVSSQCIGCDVEEATLKEEESPENIFCSHSCQENWYNNNNKWEM